MREQSNLEGFTLQVEAIVFIWQITARPPNPVIAVITAVGKLYSIAVLQPVVTSQMDFIKILMVSLKENAEITDEADEKIKTHPQIPSIASVALVIALVKEALFFSGVEKSSWLIELSLINRQKKPIVREARIHEA